VVAASFKKKKALRLVLVETFLFTPSAPRDGKVSPPLAQVRLNGPTTDNF